ncbi:MAG: hypothetical protein M2R45_04854 [Verrucomicrobia subdivision 3 bacterium]|nr:hypothetical protein [Limisphaerales bacterium]MCS1417539.1 hypothetical protein [Limisphaerales bacterium]
MPGLTDPLPGDYAWIIGMIPFAIHAIIAQIRLDNIQEIKPGTILKFPPFVIHCLSHETILCPAGRFFESIDHFWRTLAW